MRPVSETVVNRIVARHLNDIAWGLILTSSARGDIAIAKHLIISASDLSPRIPMDVDILERRLEIPAAMLARWEEFSRD